MKRKRAESESTDKKSECTQKERNLAVFLPGILTVVHTDAYPISRFFQTFADKNVTVSPEKMLDFINFAIHWARTCIYKQVKKKLYLRIWTNQ